MALREDFEETFDEWDRKGIPLLDDAGDFVNPWEALRWPVDGPVSPSPPSARRLGLARELRPDTIVYMLTWDGD